MTIAIIGALLTVLAALSPAIARWIKNKQDKAEDPETARQKRIKTAENEIANTQAGLAPDASASGVDDLDALERLREKADSHRKQ